MFKVYGCDVGPAKGGMVFDGQHFQKHDVNSLASWVSQLTAGQLVAWDAPLTGPGDPDGTHLEKGDLTQRRIERFFSRKGAFRVPKGVSVQGYAGCQHWTISQRILGLPRIGKHSSPENDLPLRPLYSQSSLQESLGESRPSSLRCILRLGCGFGAKLNIRIATGTTSATRARSLSIGRS